ncbi:hypothetical protein D3C81_334700 [compost metagenome]
MIEQVWYDTFSKLEQFTHELEKVKSYTALNELKPLWRIMKSVQLRYIPIVTEEATNRLNQVISRLEIRDVAASAWEAPSAIAFMRNINMSCSLDPVSLGDE